MIAIYSDACKLYNFFLQRYIQEINVGDVYFGQFG